jgi:predicted dithiol-disulfide oxidoreductase (DUF899 family)
VTLAGLFDGRSQLIVYHFMFPPDWDEGCPHCSFWADNFDGAPVHLAARDVTLTAVSPAPFAKIAAYKRRMGWTFPWVSSDRSSFNYDFGASFTPEALATRTGSSSVTRNGPLGHVCLLAAVSGAGHPAADHRVMRIGCAFFRAAAPGRGWGAAGGFW